MSQGSDQQYGNYVPVRTQMHTMNTDRENDNNSAAVKRPHIPNEIFVPSEHGLMMYWHIGSRRKANATVAITENERFVRVWPKFEIPRLTCGANGEQHLHGVEKEEHHQQGDAGAERQAQRLHRVQRLYVVLRLHLLRGVQQAVGAAVRPVARLLLHVEAAERAVHDEEHRYEKRWYATRVHNRVGPLVFDCLALIVCHLGRSVPLLYYLE